MRNGAGSVRLGEAPARHLMRQPRGYSKAVLASDRRERRAVPAPLHGAGPSTGPTHAEENIVAAAFARYITARESADRARRPAVLRCPTAASAAGLPARRAAAPSYAMQIVRNPKPSVFVDATPMTDFRDAMISNATGFLPHSTAPPAAVKAVAVARLGVLPEWQSACLSTPPTPKKQGWW